MTRLQQFGPYQLVKRIGGGGMAEIFLAKTAGIAGFEKHLALKMIRESHSDDPAFVTMLVNEAKIAVFLSHSNIVQVFDLGHIDDRYYIAMEYVDGCDLHALLVETSEAGKFIPFEVAAYVVQETCVGLFYAHERLNAEGQPLSIVHRDVSPHNILLAYTGVVKVADFGIAKANVRREETQLGVLKGKFSYMSPEQARGEQLDARSDIFSLGIVLYEMLTGQMLFRDTQPMHLLNAVREANIEPPSRIRREIPEALETIVMRALARDRDDRYPDAETMRRDLARFLSRYAPGFSSRDLADYLDKILRSEPTSPGLEVPSASTPLPDIAPMEREEFQTDTSTSLVFSLQSMQEMAAAAEAEEAEEPAPEAPQESTREVRVPRSDEAPTTAYNRNAVRAALQKHPGGGNLDLEGILEESLQQAEAALEEDEDVEATKLANRDFVTGALARMEQRREADGDIKATAEFPVTGTPRPSPELEVDVSADSSPLRSEPAGGGIVERVTQANERALWIAVGGFTVLALIVVLLVLL